MLTATIDFSPASTTSISRNGINGTIVLTQKENDDSVGINVNLKGLTPNHLHGFHIHDSGITNISDSLEKTCAECGGHFNPNDTEHGSVFNINPYARHAGDLINNLHTNEQGTASVEFRDDLISLRPDSRFCVVGRSIVIHEDFDDLGRRGISDPMPYVSGKCTSNHIHCPCILNPYDSAERQEESLKTGNAGKRIACANINLDA